MATLRQAEKARNQHADALAEMGVHAVGVEAGDAHGKDGYVVVAYLEQGKDPELPATLEYGKSKVKVPLVIERAERFQAQGYSADTL